MLDVVMELVRLLIQNPWLLVVLSGTVLLSLVFLESRRVKHYGEEESVCFAELEEMLENVGLDGDMPSYPRPSFSQSEFPKDGRCPSYKIVFNMDLTKRGICQIYIDIPSKHRTLDYSNEGVLGFERSGVQKTDIECIKRVSC